MSEIRRWRLLLAGLLAAMLPLRGDTCAPDPNPGPPVGIEVAAGAAWAFGAGYFQEVHITTFTHLQDSVQAFDLDLSWDSSAVQWAAAFPNAEFDQDSALFGTPVLGASSLVGISDVRHGTAASGKFRVATVYLWAPLGGNATLQLRGRLAGPTGELLNIIVAKDLDISDP